MSEVDEDLEALADDLVALVAANARDEPHAAGIMFIPWMIEPLRVRCAERIIRCMHGNLLNELFRSRLHWIAEVHKHVATSGAEIVQGPE